MSPARLSLQWRDRVSHLFNPLLASPLEPNDEWLQLGDPRSFERVPQRDEDGIGVFPEPQQGRSVWDRSLSDPPLEPQETVLRDVFDALDGWVLQPDERALIVPSTERIAGDLSERECLADPISAPRGRDELMRREDPAVGDDGMVVAPSDDALARFELGVEEAIPLVPESFAPFKGVASQATQLSA